VAVRTSNFPFGVVVPIPTLHPAVNLAISALLVLITKSLLSVVPKKLVAGVVPALPVVSQAKELPLDEPVEYKRHLHLPLALSQ
jgi:hypothetical protein